MKKIQGLSNKEVEEQIQKGNVNTLPKDNLKSNWKIIADNVFTLFNLYNLIIAIALISVKAYTNFVIIPFGIILFIQAYITRQTDITQAVIATSAALLRNVTKGVSLINYDFIRIRCY